MCVHGVRQRSEVLLCKTIPLHIIIITVVNCILASKDIFKLKIPLPVFPLMSVKSNDLEPFPPSYYVFV